MMGKRRSLVVVSLLVFIMVFSMLLLFLVVSAPVGITIDKPGNQSYNYINHTLNVTTSITASSCRYIVNGSSQGVVWKQLSNPGWIPYTWVTIYGMGIAVAPNGTIWLTGGYDSSSNFYNSVWYSPDGNTWVQATSNAQWSQRYGHSLVVKSDGSLWLMGGWDGSSGTRYNDVWNSTDGITWNLVTAQLHGTTGRCHRLL